MEGGNEGRPRKACCQASSARMGSERLRDRCSTRPASADASGERTARLGGMVSTSPQPCTSPKATLGSFVPCQHESVGCVIHFQTPAHDAHKLAATAAANGHLRSASHCHSHTELPT